MRKIAPAAISALLIFVMTVFSGCQSTKEAIAANSIEVRNNGEYIQWKNGGDEWHNLVDLNEIISKISGGADGEKGADGINGKDGADGKSVEIRKDGGYIQWRYTGGSWENLVALSELTGIAGANGKDGLNGRDGADGKDGTNGTDGVNGLNGQDGINGKDGADGKDGTNGENGKDIEIRQADSYVQWRYTGGEWQNLVALSDITGPKGADGKDGVNGRDGTDGINGKDGADGKNGTDGINGTNGLNGADGKTPEFRTDPETNQLQWRYVGEDAWLYLYDLSLLKGKDGLNGNDGKNGIDGKQIEVKKTDSHIQWRYEDGDWQDLVALSDITGPAGQNGLNGTNGINGTNGVDGKTPEFRVDSETNQLQWRYTGENTWLYLYDLSSLKGKDGTNGTNGNDGKDGMCAGYFAASGESLKNSWSSPLSFTVNSSSGDIISYNGTTKEITLSKGHSYSLAFCGTASLISKKDDVVCGISLSDGYSSNSMLATRTYVNAPKTGLDNRLTVAYNTIYTATEDITLKFQYTNMLFKDTDLGGSLYSVTIIALN